MRKPFKHNPDRNKSSNWRDFQQQNRQKSVRRAVQKSTMRLLLLVFLGAVALLAIVSFGDPLLSKSRQLFVAVGDFLSPASVSPFQSKKDIQGLLSEHGLLSPTSKTLSLAFNDELLQIETSLDPELQNYLLDNMDRKNSRYIGIVVLEADSGRILALAGFDKNDPAGNPCLSSQFPAASVFKIVTAAAAVDHCGLTAESKMHFNGYKHTLYKNQLKEQSNRYTNTISLKNAFAQSVNPVFGKIGQLRLGRTQLENSAAAFGFNVPLNFDLPLEPSHFQVEDEPYNWAEIASGFNNDTTLSPLHGALLAATVLNEGRLLEPSIVDRIVDPEGEVLYQGGPVAEQQAMSPEAASVLSQLMQSTISSGTGRRSFRGYQKDSVLSQLEIGGKTGSIDNKTHDQRFDWFVGFAKGAPDQGQLAIGVLVAHQDYIGTRATRYARMAMKYYFERSSSVSTK